MARCWLHSLQLCDNMECCAKRESIQPNAASVWHAAGFTHYNSAMTWCAELKEIHSIRADNADIYDWWQDILYWSATFSYHGSWVERYPEGRRGGGRAPVIRDFFSFSSKKLKKLNVLLETIHIKVLYNGSNEKRKRKIFMAWKWRWYALDKLGEKNTSLITCFFFSVLACIFLGLYHMVTLSITRLEMP